MNYSSWIQDNFSKLTDWALITGATSGIGLAYAHLVCGAGCNCIIVSNEEDRLASVAASLESQHGVKVLYFYCDLADYEATRRVCEHIIDRNVQVRVLINNAGFGLKGRFENIAMDRYRDILSVNALAQTALSHYFLPGMKEAGKGLHISVATINVISPLPFNAVYTATKFYVYAYALAVAQECEGSGITFQVLLPGTTDTPFHDKQGSTPSAMTMSATKVAEISLGRLNQMVCIPNRMDAFLYRLARVVPTKLKIVLSQRVAQKRLGLKY